MGRSFVLGFLAAVGLSACGQERTAPVFHPDENPALLSAWGQLTVGEDGLQPTNGVTAYELNAPLFSDYAAKLRTVWSLEGEAVADANGDLQFPVGTVITKTFYYGGEADAVHVALDSDQRSIGLSEHRLIETRLLVHRKDGWHAVSYLWNDDQTEASLKRTGAVVPLTLTSGEREDRFAYIVPNENQCAACHASDTRTDAIHPLGPTLAQLNRGTQLAEWKSAGLLAGGQTSRAPQTAWGDLSAPLNERARSYLASNCAHCHNPYGPADTSGLDLTLVAEGAALGLCKPPIAAGSGTGGHRFGIAPGQSKASILRYRMASTDPGSMMPELGRSLVHEEGVALIEQWIDAMEGDCA